MDERAGSSTMLDSSGLGNNGTSLNVAEGRPGVTAASDPTDLAFGFDGATSYVKVPDSPSLDPGSSNLSITASVNFAQSPGANLDYDVLRKGLAATAGGDFKMEIFDTGQAFCLFKGSIGVGRIKNGPDLSDGRWHSLECVRTDTTVELTVDGTTYRKAASVGSIANGSALYIGAKPGDDYMDGLIDEVQLDVG
jgi:Concanavalin A-like lectin/glucanases superfamily